MRQGEKHTIKSNKTYFLTLTVEGWINIFTRQVYRDIIISSLSYCIKEKGLNIYAYVIMSNHIHLVANSNEPYQLQDTLRDLKKFTAKACIGQLNSGPESRKEWMIGQFIQRGENSTRHKDFKFWKVGNHAIELYDPIFTWEKIN